MTPPARLLLLLALLDEIERAARPADAVVSAFFRAQRQVGDRDRGAIITEAYALMRHRARLGWWLDRTGAPDTARGRLLAWLILTGTTLDQLDQWFSGGKLAPSALSAPERQLLRQLKGQALLHPEMPEAVRLECPDWATEPLRARFGATFAAEMAAMLRPAPLDLRVNTIGTTRPAMLEALSALGLEPEPTPLAQHGIRLAERPSLATLPMLRSGAVEIQDEGSQLVAALVDARPGERVVDFCAGAGGKTMAIATQMANRGHVVACDISEGRLQRAAERFRQAGLHNIQTRLLSSETDRWVKRHKAGFDRVLVDAPCSGTGTWRRNPDARWRDADADGLDALVALQARILTSAARLVKPGGRLVYATCSLLPSENEAQVFAFLEAHPEYSLVPHMAAVPDLSPIATGDFLTLTPAQHSTDGFFAAVLQRQVNSEA